MGSLKGIGVPAIVAYLPGGPRSQQSGLADNIANSKKGDRKKNGTLRDFEETPLPETPNNKQKERKRGFGYLGKG